MIDGSKKVTDGIVAQVTEQDASFEKVLLPMAQEDNKQGLIAHILGFYQSVSTSQELRDASTEAEKLMDDYAIEASMREDVFKLVYQLFLEDRFTWINLVFPFQPFESLTKFQVLIDHHKSDYVNRLRSADVTVITVAVWKDPGALLSVLVGMIDFEDTSYLLRSAFIPQINT